ncbi:hypothetical protein ABZX85_23175 [Streptomyces sp. NPDC004539]|uniref:hypothetical protein n=1 Tax=Streptomyces sp. NPDC004539 TaxID=3154280 RepID=UPI0033B5DD92
MTSQQSIDALLDAYTDQRRALLRVLTLVACHADEIATNPALVLKALDAHPRSVAVCPPGCTGDCRPHPAVWARCTALEPSRN